MFQKLIGAILLGSLMIGATSCERLPGSKPQQGAVIGGVSGAAVGAAVGGREHRVLGAILGGALGAGGGYVIGANSDRITGKDTEAAKTAANKSQAEPATAQDAMQAATADLNNDGFVTLDEVVAMKQAGFSDEKMLEKLKATNQVFELTPDQKKYLTDRGVSPEVVAQMEEINKEERQQLLNATSQDVISQPAPAK